MNKLVLCAAVLAMTSAPALAQGAAQGDAPNAAAALCKLRGQHIATAYQPGVDVRGNAVVAADVNAAAPMGGAAGPDVVRIPMTVDLAQRLGSVPAGAELKTATGMVEIYKDGRVSFNGQDMTEVAIVLCDGNKPAQYDIPASGQAAAVENAVTAPAAPVAPSKPVDKIVVPVDAPALPVAAVPVAPQVAPPVVSRIRTDADVSPKQIPQGAMATKPLPPQTLGQFIVPAQKAPEALQPPPTNAADVKAPDTVVRPPADIAPPAAQTSGERTNQDMAKDDGIIWGQGN